MKKLKTTVRTGLGFSSRPDLTGRPLICFSLGFSVKYPTTRDRGRAGMARFNIMWQGSHKAT